MGLNRTVLLVTMASVLGSSCAIDFRLFGQGASGLTGGGSGVTFTGVAPFDGTLLPAAGVGSESTGGALYIPGDGLYSAGYTDGDLDGTNAGIYDAIIFKLHLDGSLAWVKQFGTADSDGFFDVKTAPDGNLIALGYTEGDLADTVSGSRDIVIAKFSAADGSTMWMRQLGTSVAGTGGADYPYELAVNAAGECFIVGNTNGSLFETNGGNYDIFVMKFASSNGATIWGRQLGLTTLGAASAGDERGMTIALDDSGNIYLGGNTSGNLGETNAGAHDGFVVKLNPAGGVTWRSQLGDVTLAGAYGAGMDYLRSVAVDSATGDVYWGGGSWGDVADTNGGGGEMDVTLGKINSAGVSQWVRQFGTSAPEALDVSGGEMIEAVRFFGGNLYYAGGTGSGLFETLRPGSSYNTLVGSLDGATGASVWSKQFGQTSGAGMTYSLDQAYSIISLSATEMVVGGQYSSASLDLGFMVIDIP